MTGVWFYAGNVTRKALSFRFALIVALMAATLILTGACGLFNAKARFSSELSQVDAEIGAGRDDEALKRLRRLRKNAGSASQWLSIAKRERSLDSWESASETLYLALYKMPANDSLNAVLIDTLYRAGKADEAISRARSQTGTEFALQAAALDILGSSFSGKPTRDPRSWETASKKLGGSVWLRNAAVWHAFVGNLPAACAAVTASRAETDPERKMNALLFYDAGFPEEAERNLRAINTADPESQALLADSYLERRNDANAVTVWARIVNDWPGFSPVPWYNLAVMAPTLEVSNVYLERLLDAYPSYFPAIARYVAHYIGADAKKEKDSLTRELETRGMYSLSMKDEALSHPATLESVSNRLESAISSTAGAPDIRLLIERLKVEDHETSDPGLSGSRIWKLLENYSDNGLLVRYAMWYFLKSGQYETSFSLNRERAGVPDPFYAGIELAMKGDLDAAETCFKDCAASREDSWAALANLAVISKKKGHVADAVDYLYRATSFAPGNREASDLQYEAAILLSAERDTRRAEQVLMRSLELNPANERASVMLRRLRGMR